jgi:phage gpG-like protein
MPALNVRSGISYSVAPSITIDFPAILQDISKRTSETALREAQVNARQFRDTGALVDSLEARVTDTGAEIGSSLPYAAAVEEGRSPDRRAPPIEALSGWIERHGIPEQHTFLVARAIGLRGLPGRQFMRRAYETTDRQMPSIIDAAIKGQGIA